MDFQFLSIDPYVLMSVPVSLDYCSFAVSFEIGKCLTKFFLQFRIVLSILSLLNFHTNFKII